jgi:hypothetical protein
MMLKAALRRGDNAFEDSPVEQADPVLLIVVLEVILELVGAAELAHRRRLLPRADRARSTLAQDWTRGTSPAVRSGWTVELTCYAAPRNVDRWSHQH